MPAAAPGGGASRRRSAAGQGGKRSRRVRQDHRHALLLAPSSAWYIARRAQRSVRSVRVVEWRVRVRVRCRFDLMRMRVRIFWRPVFGDVINAPRRPVAVGATSTPPSPPPAALLHAFCFACFLHAFCICMRLLSLGCVEGSPPCVVLWCGRALPVRQPRRYCGIRESTRPAERSGGRLCATRWAKLVMIVAPYTTAR